MQRERYHQTHSDDCGGGAGLFPPLLRSARLTHLSSPGPPSVSLPSWRFSPFRCLTVNSNPSCFGNVIQAEAPAAVGGGGRNSGVGGEITTFFFLPSLLPHFLLASPGVQVATSRYQLLQPPPPPPPTTSTAATAAAAAAANPSQPRRWFRTRANICVPKKPVLDM